MHAFIFTATDTDLLNIRISDLVEEQKASRLDFELEKISDIKTLRSIVKLKLSKKTAIVIKNIDSATLEAQNSFLKNLEEPQEKLIYILTANNLNQVIPTIISRCQIIKLISNKTSFQSDGEANFSNLSIDEQLIFISKIKDRSEAVNFTQDLMMAERTLGHFDNVEQCLETYKKLQANGNVPLQLLNLVAKMNSHGR